LTLLGLICLTWSLFALPLYFILPRRIGTANWTARHHVGLSHLCLVLSITRALPLGPARHRLAPGRTAADPGPESSLPDRCAVDSDPASEHRLRDEILAHEKHVSRLRFPSCPLRAATIRRVKWSRNRWPICWKGAVLLLFPEGTRTTRAPINSLVGQRGPDRQTCQCPGTNPGDRNRFALLEQGLAAVPATHSAHHLPGPARASASTRPRTSPPSRPSSIGTIGANSRAHCNRAGSRAR
jgi:hypothetical protein